ncbi:PAS domain S-box protein [Scytonema sp. NUACC21]
MHRRLTNLYESISSTTPVAPNLVPKALVELGNASEMVKLATEEIYQQNEELIKTRNLLEAEQQRYQDLFEFAPDAYLVTDMTGIIQEVNHAASHLFNVPQQYLLGKPIINYVALQERQNFRNYLFQLSKCDKVTELVLSWQKRNGEFFEAAISVGVVCNEKRNPIALRWLIRDITKRKLTELTFSEEKFDLSQGRSIYKYCKGETIPLHPGTILCVQQGLVKLSTLCETGEEVLVGLATQGMVFSSSLTSLHTYQATALSNVELVSINLTEITASPTICQHILPKINQRLQQTEAFLAIASRRRVQDRFHDLLQLLKKEIGQPVAEGIRLNTRFTHEDFASACCTTRVTITRILGKLQKQGDILLDSKHHIIIKC